MGFIYVYATLLQKDLVAPYKKYSIKNTVE